MNDYIFKISLRELVNSRKKGKKSVLNKYYNKFILYCFMYENKFYIGITTNLEIRIKNYLSNRKNTHHIERIIKKNIDKVEFYIIKELQDLKSLKKEEITYIKKYNSVINGYNLTYGGELEIPSKETKLRMSMSALNKKEVFFKNIITKEIKIYESVSEASRNLKINKSNIFNSIKKEFLLLKKYMVRYDKSFNEDNYSHKNKVLMKNNTNANKYTYILTSSEEKIKAYSLKELLKKTKHLKTTRRKVENCINNKKTYSYKIFRNEK